jgi:hypothetical protein
MTGAGLEFPARPVEQHAGHVEQVADAVATARAAVHDVTMDNGAYGMLCQFLPGVLSPVFGLGVDALAGSVDALQETAARLRGTAAAMLGTDEASSRRITGASESPR